MTYKDFNANRSLILLTDLYQLTMAYGYWKVGRQDDHAVFHLFFRKTPFQGGYAVAAGLGPVLDFLEDFRFEEDDIAYLSELKGANGEPLFSSEFLSYLGDLRLSCDIEALPEGTLVFAHEPILRVEGPLLQVQLLETILLNLVNFQTLIATKAARVCSAAGDDEVLEFGLRRAQGIDGALAASRAAYLGGCAATSNVLAGKLMGIPVRGTHAHSWIMAFDSEQEAFDTYAEALPNNCVFLVDTYDTITGVHHAIDTGKRLRERGYEMLGIRLDSGDLAYLSREARVLLDDAGFESTKIVASNDLDEHLIRDLKSQGAAIAVWGVGTNLVTAKDQPALGGVFKMGAIRPGDGDWEHRIKLSERVDKVSIPGRLQIRRFVDDDGLIGDMIYDTITHPEGPPHPAVIVDPKDPTRTKTVSAEAEFEDLLRPVVRNGNIIAKPESLEVARDRVRAELQRIHPGIRRLTNPHEYPVGLEANLHGLRLAMIKEARQAAARTRSELV